MWWRRAVAVRAQELRGHSSKHAWRLPLLSYSDAPKKKGKAAPLQERRMVDRFRLWAKGGEGGNGCWSYRRSRTDRHGKADGGDGGRGGDVILECSSVVWDFSNLQHHLNAKRGGHGAPKNNIGSRGSNKVMQIPVGTVIHLVSGEPPSLMESTSIKSLDPWEISEDVEADPSKTVQSSDNGITSEKKIVDILCSKVDVGKSARAHDKVLGSSDPYKLECEDYTKNSLSNSHVGYLEIEHKVDDVDAYEMQNEGEEVGEEEHEEKEVVQYSVAELTKSGQRILIARGGEGGLGNASLKKDYKPCKNTTCNGNASDPQLLDGENQFSLTRGMPGSETVLILELKSIADVGLVGMPNAGKSTLLGAISRAKPIVGHYAFTTLRPNIGNLNYDDFFSMTVADIPGLIKGAHENRGLGHAFLRHIERTKVLAYVVDLAAALDGRKGIPPWEQLRDLVLELEYHQEGLSKRPSLVVANKIDEDGADKVLEELKRRVQGVPIFPVCAVLEEGISELKAGLRRLMDGKELQRLELDRIMVD